MSGCNSKVGVQWSGRAAMAVGVVRAEADQQVSLFPGGKRGRGCWQDIARRGRPQWRGLLALNREEIALYCFLDGICRERCGMSSREEN